MYQLGKNKTNFDYLDIPPQNWVDTLQSLKNAGVETVSVRIPWGAHEPVKGMRDFSRSSRLRLERILKSIAETRLKAEISFGFFSAKEMIPNWAYATKSKTIAPAQAWTETAQGLVHVEVPSLFDQELWTAFEEFSDEVVRLSALYATPHGPVEKVKMDLGIFANDCSLFQCESFVKEFEKAYPTIESVGEKYNVILKNTPPVNSAQGFRVLYKSRPWLASFDYKRCREKVLANLKRKAESISSRESLGDHFEVDLQDPSWLRHRKAVATLIDPVFLEFCEKQMVPFFPEGIVAAQSAYAFRMAEYFSEQARVSEHAFFPLPLIESREAQGEKYVNAICGKYLPRAAFLFLEKIWMRGGNVVFPFGFPQFDGEMHTFDWTSGTEKKTERIGATVMQYFSRGLGKVWSPVHALEMNQNVWASMEAIRLGIESLGKPA